jgi:hypothetical protein
MSDWGTTLRVSAQVVLADGSVLEGDLHLAARTSFSADVESPLDMLNRADPFFALSLQHGGVTFVSKAQAAVVSCRDQAPLRDPERASAARLVALEVSLATGAEFRGMATYELPPARARTLDYVNGSDPFFTVWADDLTRYINKSLVRLIRPLD